MYQKEILEAAATAICDGNLDILKTYIDEGLDVNSKWNLKTLLHVAVLKNRPTIVKLLLDRGADINAKSQTDAESAFLWAAQYGYEEIVKIFLDSGADVHTITHILHKVVEKGYKNVIKLLVDRGADVNAKDTNGKVLLLVAGRCKNEEIAKILLDAGADIETSYVLHDAVESGYSTLTRLLLSRGADVNLKNKNGKTPLQLAALHPKRRKTANMLLDAGADVDTRLFNIFDVVRNGHKQLTEQLLNKGAEVNERFKYNGKTPLHIAVIYKQDEDMVRILLDAGAKVNIRDKFRRSVLYTAFWESKVSTAVKQLLISKGANINIKKKNGKTPLYEAALRGEEELVKLLLGKGAPVNAALKDGKTPLYVTQNCKVAEILLENGANINAKTASGQSVLYEAVRKNNKSKVELLLSKGADVNAETKDGKTALHQAILNNSDASREIVDILLKNNADINARTNDGTSILAEAIRCQNREVAKALLNNEIDLNTQSEDGMTPLLEAVKNDDEEIVNILLDKGANLNAKTVDNKTVFWFAILNALNHLDMYKEHVAYKNDIFFSDFYTKRKAVIKILLDRGADINNTSLHPLLMKAIKCGRRDIVNFLLAHGANIDLNEIDPLSGNTAIHEAAKIGINDLVETLVRLGAKINVRNKIGDTLLHTAAKGRNDGFGGVYIIHCIDPLLVGTIYFNTLQTEPAEVSSPFILSVLLNHGADLEAENASNETALFCAAISNAGHKVSFLLNNGANVNHEEIACICYYSHFFVQHKNRNKSYSVSLHTQRLLWKHIIKRKCARMFIIKQYSDHFPFGMSEYQTECSKEITNIKNKVLYNNISLYDVLIQPTKQLVGYLRDENFVQSIKLDEYEAKFPKYYEMIKYKIQNGLRQKELLEYGKRFINCCVFGSLGNLPDICCNCILNYFSEEDLVTLERVLKCM